MAIKLFHGKGLNKGQNEGTDGHYVDFNSNKVFKKLHIASFRIKEGWLGAENSELHLV